MPYNSDRFTLNIPENQLSDLKARLALTRFPDQAPDAPWAYGSDVGFMRQLVDYWQKEFDWRAQEALLNQWPQYKVSLHDIELHYLHVPAKSGSANSRPAMPLLLSHGWPGSVFEFIGLIERLTDPAAFGGDPADAMTVVVPSLPGYGLSFVPNQKRFGVEAIGQCLADLMTLVLGYQRFGVQGGDWGSFVASRIAHTHPHQAIGIHLNMMPVRRDPKAPADNDEERRYLQEELPQFLKEETGYQWIQGTRPQTLAFGLTDSPVGLAAWITEKFRAWSDCDGDPLSVFTMDQLLANISLYWFTGCIGASFWPYYARMHSVWPIPQDTPITVPTGYAAFPREILRPPRSLAEKAYSNIQRWQTMPRGGHFAAMEQPKALADEVLAFFRPLRSD